MQQNCLPITKLDLKIMSLWRTVYDHFKNNDVLCAISLLEEYISSRDSQKFACVVGASFLNPPTSVLGELNRFIETNEKQFDVKAAYIEMNGFDINYDRWYFNLFAYSSYSPQFDEAEWLCEWQSPSWPDVELFGMDSAQQAFAWYHEQQIWNSQPDLKPIYEAAMLLIMAKFAGFIGSVLKTGRLTKSIPILVTAHGFESVARYEP